MVTMLRLLLAVLLDLLICAPVLAANPPLTHVAVVQLIEDDLDLHQPFVQINLGFASPDAQVHDLECVGLLESVGEVRDDNNCAAVGERLTIPEEGQRKASELGWSIWGEQLYIPVGRLVLAGPVTTSPSKDASILDATVPFRVVWNENAKFLRTLGPSSDWMIHTYPRVHVAMLDSDSTFVASTSIISERNGKWSVFAPYSQAIITCN